MNKRQVQSRKTKKKIYEIAVDAISRKGYDNVTIQEICKKANVSIGTFYHYFSAKEGLIVAIYKLADEYFEEAYAHCLQSTNAVDRVIEFIVVHQMGYAKERGIDFVTQVYKSQIKAGNTFFISPERSLPKIIDMIVEEGQRKKEIRTDMTAREISRFILRFSRGMLYDWCVHEGDYDIIAEANNAVAIMVRNCFAADSDSR